MSVEWLRLGWDVLVGLGTLLTVVITWSIRRYAAPKAELDEMNERLTRVEASIGHLPTDQDLVNVRQEMSMLRAQMAEITGEFRAFVRLVERIDTFLREHDG